MKKIVVLFLIVCSFFMITSCKSKEYTVTLKFDDGTVFETLTVKEDVPTTLNNPSLDGHTFIGWYDGDELIDGSKGFTTDISLVARFEINLYTYKFIVDGVVIKEETVNYGSIIEYPSVPTKEGSAENSYVFKEWDNSATTLLEDEVFNAVFESKKNQYTYKFVNDDNTLIKEETLDYGSTIVYPEDPYKEATKEYTYNFTGWNKDVTVLTENVTFKAIYSKVKNQYTYKFLNYDGTVLKEETVDYGTMPVAPSDPLKEGTDDIEYKFIGWDKKIEKITDNVVYTAVFEEQIPINSLEGLKISFLGDSISTFYAEGSEMNSYYGGENQFFYPRYSQSIKTVDLTWWYKLIKNNNMQLGINNSWSGSQACGSGNSAGQSDERINTLNENGNPDIVIVYLGTNDIGSNRSTKDLESAITTIINKINALCDADIFLTTLGYSAYSGGSYTDAKRIEYNAKLREIASLKGCGIVPLDEYVVDDNYMIYLGDSLHYNAKGANLLSLIAEKALKEYYNIPFDKEIVVEHQEPLPEGVVGMVTATASTDFWSTYEKDVFLADSSITNPIYSFRIELTKNTENGKYYVTKIQKSGESSPYSGDLIIIISDSHTESKALTTNLQNVAVGNIAEFNESMSFPVEIIFKENDGNAPEVTPDDPVEENPAIDGQLYVCAYNTGVWAESIYKKGAIAFTYEDMDKSSTYINYYIISLTYDDATSKYKITGLKTIDVKCEFDVCDYYILIFRDIDYKSYFESAKLEGLVTINGDITSGSCNLKFE